LYFNYLQTIANTPEITPPIYGINLVTIPIIGQIKEGDVGGGVGVFIIISIVLPVAEVIFFRT